MLANRQRAHERCSLAISAAVILVLSALPGCGAEQQSGPVQANSVPVSLRLTFPQQSAALEPAATRASRFWAALEAWLPTASTAWARESVSNISTLRVTVTGEGFQNPVTDEKQLSNPGSNDVITFELNVPQGVNRVFTVDGFKNQLIIFTGRSAPISLTAGQAASVDITLVDNTGTISGSIPNGVNIGATVTMTVQGTSLSAPISSTGTFTLDGVPRGEYSLKVSAPGYVAKDLPVVVPAGDTTSVGTIVLDQIPSPSGIIDGTVINANNQAPIGGATVMVTGSSLSATTLGNGSFILPGVPAGSQTLTVSAPGFSSRTTPTIQVTVGNSSAAGAIALTPLPTTGSVTGTVVNATTRGAISDASIAINGLTTKSTGNGSFTLPGVPAGPQTLTVSAPGFFTSTTTTVQVTAGSTSNAGTINLTPVITTGSITGTVINANTQAAIDRATITVNGLSLTTTSASNGSFTILNVPAGSHALQVSAAGFTSVTTPSIQVTAGSTSSAGTISLSPIITTGTIIGTVINADTRAPLSGVTVSVMGSTISTRTLDNGSFRLDGIPQGAQTVLVSVSGAPTVTRTVTVVGGQSVSTGTIAVQPPSTDADLSALSIAVGETLQTLSPTFSRDTLDYSVNLVSTIPTQVTVSAAKSDPNAVMTGSVNAPAGQQKGQATVQLVATGEVGSTTVISITVTSPSGSTKTYSVNVTRPRSTAKLGRIVVDGVVIDPNQTPSIRCIGTIYMNERPPVPGVYYAVTVPANTTLCIVIDRYSLEQVVSLDGAPLSPNGVDSPLTLFPVVTSPPPGVTITRRIRSIAPDGMSSTTYDIALIADGGSNL